MTRRIATLFRTPKEALGESQLNHQWQWQVLKHNLYGTIVLTGGFTVTENQSWLTFIVAPGQSAVVSPRWTDPRAETFYKS